MRKLRSLNVLPLLIIALFITAGGITAAAVQRTASRENSLDDIKLSDAFTNYNEDANVMNRSIAFKRQQVLASTAKQQEAAVKAALVKTSPAKPAEKTTKSVAKSDKSVKTTAAKTASTNVKTAAAKTAVKSKTVASRGTSTSRSSSKAAEIVELAKQYTGTKYVYGGASPSTGFDCSGFTMYIYNKLGVSLPHSAAQQYSHGTKVGINELLIGDLVFFYSPISHVGIYIGNGQFIHAANPKKGVVITDLNGTSYRNDFVGAVRIFN